MADHKAISNGQNARPRDANIGTTAGGLPNDTSAPVEITPEEEARIAASLGRPLPSGPGMPYDVTHAESRSDGAPLAEGDSQGELHESSATHQVAETNEAMDEAFNQGEQELGDRLADRRGSPD